MVSIEETIYNMIQIVLITTTIQPTKLMLGHYNLIKLKNELIENRRLALDIIDLNEFLGMEIITKDHYGNDLPITFIGVC